MKKSKSKLLENTIMLYILTFSSYFFNFVTIPYQTRVLGPEIFGKIGFAIAFSTYFKLLFDFGFLLSATEEVSKNRENKRTLSKILTCVNILKCFFILFGFLILIVLIFSIKILSSNKLLFILYFSYVAIDSFQPDFIYRGIENMKVITFRNVCVKLLFTILIFVFLKKPDQYLIVPILNIVGSVLAIVIVYINVFKKLKLKFIKVKFNEIKNVFNSSKIFFLSRIATTVYGAMNTSIIGFIYPTGNTLGYYTSSDKILTAGRYAMSPISDSVYPYMVKNKDFKLIRKILLYLMPIITVACVVCFIFSKKICILLFGAEYAGSAMILKYMLPIIWITLPSYLLGFPTMSPLGLKKQANLSVIIASIFHIIAIAILWFTKLLNIKSICVLTIFTEFLILILRVYFIFNRKDK